MLSVQLVISMVFASLFSKLVPRYSLAKRLLASSGLVRYLAPDDAELKQLAGIPVNQSARANLPAGANKRQRQKAAAQQANGKDKARVKVGDAFADFDVFNIPRNLPVQLEKTPVTWGDLAQLRFYDEYQWLVDFSVYALLVYFVTEVYFSILLFKTF